jgi:hypothetical protein
MRSLLEDGKPNTVEIGPNGTSLDLLQIIYRSPAVDLPIRIRCAMACLPFEHPRLAVTAVINEQSFAEVLERRLQHLKQIENGNGGVQAMEQAKLIEAKPVNGGNADARLPPPIPDRRFRRI